MGTQIFWTAETVEILKALALEGRSASVIAAELGAPSRNAVIGKANRIGIKLNGDGRAGMPDEPQTAMRRAPFANAIDRAPVRAPKRRASSSFAEAEIGEMRRVGFEDIHRFACRWPLGDPTSEEFAYCGLQPAAGHSYCAGHCRLAYRSSTSNARRGCHQGQSSAPASPWRAR